MEPASLSRQLKNVEEGLPFGSRRWFMERKEKLASSPSAKRSDIEIPNLGRRQCNDPPIGHCSIHAIDCLAAFGMMKLNLLVLLEKTETFMTHVRRFQIFAEVPNCRSAY